MSKTKKASPEVRQRILDCLKNGRVEVAGDLSLMNKPAGPVEITSIDTWGPWKKERDGKTIGNDGGFDINWSKPGKGFGGATFVLRGGKWDCDDEFTRREFIKEVVAAAIAWDGEWKCCAEFMTKESIISDVLSMVETIELRSDTEEF